MYQKLKEKIIEEFNKNGTRFKNTLGYQFLRGRYFKEYEKKLKKFIIILILNLFKVFLKKNKKKVKIYM